MILGYYKTILDRCLLGIGLLKEGTTMQTQYLKLSDGTIAFDDQGQGLLVLCMRGGGDLRSEYRFLTPLLVAAGYRAVTMDRRGPGDSSPYWPRYTDAALGSDMLPLLKHVGAGRRSI